MGKKLAIRGHSTRGKEVIKLLEMMGSEAIGAKGYDEHAIYVIPENGIIDVRFAYQKHIDKYAIFTLEEFLEKCPFKVGDVIKFPNNMAEEIAEMKWDEELEDIIYTSVSGWTRSCSVPKNTNNKANTNMNENKVESTGFMQMGKTVAVCFNPENYEDEVELQLGNYEIAVRDGKTYAVRKKSRYPKTYDECCKVVNASPYIKLVFNIDDGQKYSYDVDNLQCYENIRRIKICRDAYWKIAGKELGLDKPWEPDWNHINRKFYCIYNSKNDIVKGDIYSQNKILAFPTEEIRDAFYENFKDLIEQCKELL